MATDPAQDKDPTETMDVEASTAPAMDAKVEASDQVTVPQAENDVVRDNGNKNDTQPKDDTAVVAKEEDEKVLVKTEEQTEEAIKNEDDTQTSATTATNNNNSDRQWDHTSRKVVVHNVLKFLRAKELEKLTSSWLLGHEHLGIKITKVKKPPRDNWVKVTLETDDMVDPFIKLINGENNPTGNNDDGNAQTNRRGKALFAKRADEMEEERNRKRRDREDGSNNTNNGNGGRENNNNKRGKFEAPDRILTNDEVRDAITPLWKMTYEEQLQMKWREMVKKCAMKICKEVKEKFRILEKEAKRNPQGNKKPVLKTYDWIAGKRAIEVEKPIPSPLMYEYRNKCEFTCGYNHYREDVKTEKEEMAGVEPVGEDATDVKQEKEEGVKAEQNNENPIVAKDETTAEAEGEGATTEPNKDDTTATIVRKKPAAGFLAGGWQGGVHPPHCLQNMPDWSCGLADIINRFHATSTIPPYDTKNHTGLWRTFTIRCSLRTNECMVIVLHAPASGGAGAKNDGSDDYTALFDGEKERLVQMLTEGAIPKPERNFPEGHVKEVASGEDEKAGDAEGIKVTSIYFQEYEGLSHPSPEHPVQHAFGKKFLEERLGQCTFQISPGAFFQTNTEGAEKLYSIVVDRIKEVTNDPEQTLLFDVCCGTGTIGLTCLKEGVVGRLVGVDISEPAIEDAKVNAEKNGYPSASSSEENPTTRFIASRAENVLADEMRNIPRSTPTVAVVDPARDGLHGNVVKTLRLTDKIDRLVYVSCNPTGTLVRDAAMLCAPPTKRYPGRPFKVTLSQPVDMFPLTSHCEMVMTFDRMSQGEYEKCHSKE